MVFLTAPDVCCWKRRNKKRKEASEPMQILNQDIKDRSFKPAYLLYGEEEFLKNSYKNRLREAVTGGDT